ncbi:MAG: AAA family ATPase [Puniceicoccaceae bacterium]
MTRRIRITGPEATGKSTLAEALARRFDCPWVPEYARTYLESLGRPYREADLVEILAGQEKMEDRAAETAGRMLVCDTGPEVIWVWSRFKYGRADPRIEEAVRRRTYDRTLLLDVDLPWTPDPLRENPSIAERRALFAMYEDLLRRTAPDFAVVSGRGEARLGSALAGIGREWNP